MVKISSVQCGCLCERGARSWQPHSVTQAGVSAATWVMTHSTSPSVWQGHCLEHATGGSIAPASPNPFSCCNPCLGRDRTGAAAGHGMPQSGKAKPSDSLAMCSMSCKPVVCTLSTEALRAQGRGTGTAAGLQPQTVPKWVSICVSTRSAGRITPTA